MKYLYTISFILLIVIIIFIIYKDKITNYISGKAKEKDQEKPNEETGNNNDTGLDKNDLLENGSSGEMVELLQSMLNIILHAQGKTAVLYYISDSCLTDDGDLLEDGNFGECTETILREVTGKNKITVNELSLMFPEIFTNNMTGGKGNGDENNENSFWDNTYIDETFESLIDWVT